MVGEYVEMQSSQGNYSGGIYDSMLDGFAGIGAEGMSTAIDLISNLDSNAGMSESNFTEMIIKYARELDVVPDEFKGEGKLESLSKDELVESLGGDTNGLSSGMSSYVNDLKGSLGMLTNSEFPLTEGYSKNINEKERIKGLETPYDKALAKVVDQVSKENKFGEKRYRNPFSRTAANTDTSLGIVEANRKGLRTLIGDDSVTEAWTKSEKEDFWGGAILGLSESLAGMVGGQAVGKMIGGAGTVGWAQRTAQMYAQVSDHVGVEMEDNAAFDDITEAEKTMVKMPIGIAVGTLEAIGFRNVLNQKGFLNKIVGRSLAKVSGKGYKPGVSKNFSEFIRQDVESMISRGLLTITAAGLAEFETGAAQEMAEIKIKDIYNSVKESDMFETPDEWGDYVNQVVRAGGQEMVGGWIMGTPSAVANSISGLDVQKLDNTVFEVFDKLTQDPKLKTMYVTKLKQRILDPKSDTDAKSAQEELDTVNKIQGLMPKIPKGYSTQKKKLALQLLYQKSALENEIGVEDNVLSKKKQVLLGEVNAKLESLVNEDIRNQQNETTDTNKVPDFKETEEKTNTKVGEDVSVEEAADIETFFDGSVSEDNEQLTPNLSINRKNSTELGSKKNREKNNVVRIANMGAKAISKILPNVRIVLHESNDEYLKFAKYGKGRAEYNPSNEVIHVNLSEATKSTVPHEIFHAVLISKIKEDSAIAKTAETMMLSVRKSLANNSKLAKEIDDFAASYTGDQAQFQNEERLAELIGIISSADVFKELSKPTKNIIVQWVKDIAKRFGIKIGSDFGKNDSDVIDLLNTIARKTKTGEVIDESDIKIISKEKPTKKKTDTKLSLFSGRDLVPTQIYSLSFKEGKVPPELDSLKPKSIDNDINGFVYLTFSGQQLIDAGLAKDATLSSESAPKTEVKETKVTEPVVEEVKTKKKKMVAPAAKPKKSKNKIDNGEITEESRTKQEPSVKAIESKAESTEETDLNEAIEEVDEVLEITRKPIDEIETDEERFQGRDGLNEDVVNDIADNFKDKDQDPIHIWTDPKNGKTYVLSGHHRLAGAKKANRKDVKVVDVTEYYTEQEAIAFATEEANANRTMETPLQRAATLKKKREKGDSKSELNKFLKKEGRNKTFVENLSFLNPKGLVVQALKAFQKTTDKENSNEIEKIADWIGDARKRNKELTDAHEKELFDFLSNKDQSKRITNKSDFLSKVNSITGGLYFEVDKPLNIARFKNKTEGEKQYDKETQEQKDKINALESRKENIKDRLNNPNNPEYINPNSNDYKSVTNSANKAVEKIDKDLAAERKKLLEITQKKGNFQRAGLNQGGLFDSPSTRQQKSVTEIINEAREDNFREPVIRDYLTRVKGFSTKVVDKLMELNEDSLSSMPKSFGAIEGGAKAGIKLFNKVENYRVKLIKKNNSKKPESQISEQEIIDKTIEFLHSQPEYIKESDTYTQGSKAKGTKVTKNVKAFSSQQAAMTADLQSTIGVRPTENMASKLRMAKIMLTQRKKGVRDLNKVKTEIRNFIRKSLPKSLYTRAEVITLINKVNQANEGNIENILDEVNEFVITKNISNLESKIEGLLNYKTTKTQSGKKVGKGVDLKTSDRIKRIKQMILSPKDTDIESKIDELIQAYNELRDNPEQSDLDREAMVDLQIAISYNSSLLESEDSVSKLASLDSVYSTLSEILSLGRSSLKQELLESHLKYQKQFELGYEAITGNKVDLSNEEESSKALNDAQYENNNDDERKD